MTKKVLSIVLSVLMVVSMMSVMAVATANAADFSSDVKTIFLTDAQGWDSAGIPYVHYWKEDTSYPAPSYTAVTTKVDNNDWVQMSRLFDNSLGQSVYGVNIPDDANKVEFNVDSGNNGKQTSVTSNVYDGSWWYVDANKDCQICTTSAYDTTGQALSLSAAFVDNTGADRYFVLDGRYYYRHSSTNAIKQYNNDSELMVAEIVGGAHGGEKFTDVNDAVKAAGNNGTVMLINDIKSNVNISEKCNTTLDLNGHTITNTSGSGITLGSAYSNPITFTIKDTSADQTGGITINKKYDGDGCISDSSGRKVVIEGGTYTSNANALYVSSDEGWKIKGGTFNGDVKVISALDVTGGEINGDINATGPSWKVDPAEVTISGGTVDGDLNSTNGSTFEVSGGTFTSDVSAYTTSSTYQNANGEVVAKAANTIYDDGDFAKAAAEGGSWYIVADVNGDGVTVTSNLKIWNTDKDHTIAGDITVADGKSIAKGGKKKVTFTGKTTLNGGSVSDANFTEIIVANDPYVHGQINNVPSGAVIKNGDGNRIVYDAISLTYAAKSGNEVYLVDDISDMYMTMNVNSGNFVLHGDGHKVNFTINGDYASAIGKNASIAIDDLTVTVASGKALKSFIKANAADDNTGTVTINDVSATGFSTDDVYTGGGTWTFTDATVKSATQPECPEGWEAVDNNDGTWSIIAHVHAYTTSSFNWTQDASTGDWTCDTLTLSCACGDTQDYEVTGFFGASAVTVTANADGSFTYSVSKKVDGVTYSDTKTNAANSVIKSTNQLKAAAKKGGAWELGSDLTGVTDVQCANGFVLDGKNHTVTRHASVSTQAVFRTTTNPAEVTLKNLTIDGIEGQADLKPAIATKQSNPSNGNVINLENVTITNYDFDQANNGVVLAWGQSTVNMTDCNVVTDSTYDVWGGAASKVNVDGGKVGGLYLNGGTSSANLTNNADVESINAANGSKIATDAPEKISVGEDYKLKNNGDGTYTVVAKDLQDLAEEGFDVPKEAGLGFVDTNNQDIVIPAKASILGVQLRKQPVGGYYENGDGKNGLRFITAVDEEFLANSDIKDYGYLITINNITRFQTCKNTTNTVITSGDSPEDGISYFTAAIYNIPANAYETDIKVQFVFKSAVDDSAVATDDDQNIIAKAMYKPANADVKHALTTKYKDVYKFFNGVDPE
jgi:hypothetical protein